MSRAANTCLLGRLWLLRPSPTVRPFAPPLQLTDRVQRQEAQIAALQQQVDSLTDEVRF